MRWAFARFINYCNCRVTAWPPVLAIICCSDYAYCRGFNPKIKLTRTKTLMQGDDCCDFRWELED